MNLSNKFTKIFITLIFILALFLNTSKTFGYSRESMTGVIRQAGEDKNKTLRVMGVDPSGKTFNNTVFGELVTATRQDSISVNFEYNFSTYEVDYTSLGVGTIEYSRPTLVLKAGNGTGEVTARSKNSVRYRAGHETYSYFTASFTKYWDQITQEITNEIKQIAGLCTGDNGFAIGLSNEVFGIFKQKSGSIEFTSQDNFNNDKIDGTGITKFNIDVSKINVFRITFGYLGVANVFFEVLGNDGEWVLFHKLQWNNMYNTTHIDNTFLPIRFNITKNATEEVTVEIQTASWAGGITDGGCLASGDREQFFSNIKTISATTLTNILTIKVTDEFENVENNVTSKLVFVSFASEGTKVVRIDIIKNATLGGTPSYAYKNKASSTLMYDTAGTTVAGGEVKKSFALGKTDSKDSEFIIYKVDITKGDTLTFAAYSTGASDILVSVGFIEEF